MHCIYFTHHNYFKVSARPGTTPIYKEIDLLTMDKNSH